MPVRQRVPFDCRAVKFAAGHPLPGASSGLPTATASMITQRQRRGADQPAHRTSGAIEVGHQIRSGRRIRRAPGAGRQGTDLRSEPRRWQPVPRGTARGIPPEAPTPPSAPGRVSQAGRTTLGATDPRQFGVFGVAEGEGQTRGNRDHRAGHRRATTASTGDRSSLEVTVNFGQRPHRVRGRCAGHQVSRRPGVDVLDSRRVRSGHAGCSAGAPTSTAVAAVPRGQARRPAPPAAEPARWRRRAEPD